VFVFSLFLSDDNWNGGWLCAELQAKEGNEEFGVWWQVRRGTDGPDAMLVDVWARCNVGRCICMQR
jgi:hypothetical protein